mgnify:CR=1 FL=1
MKRLVFKKEFKGVENALRLIPESYKVNNKQFQMTDGNEKYEIRWEGNLTEGRAIITKASDKNLMTEDMQKMTEHVKLNETPVEEPVPGEGTETPSEESSTTTTPVGGGDVKPL